MNAPKILWYDDQECLAGPIKLNSNEIDYVRADITEKLIEALIVALQAFRAYQAHHEYSGEMEKAERNKEYAEQMEEALKLLEEE